MSVWTHVAATVRIDDFRFSDDKPLPDWDEIFGKECFFESPEEVWDDCEAHPEKYLPCGSEGTLQKTAWINPDSHETAAYTVTIFGDLRDYENPKDVIEWFRKIVESGKIGIRQAVITATDGYNTYTWTYLEEWETLEAVN